MRKISVWLIMVLLLLGSTVPVFAEDYTEWAEENPIYTFGTDHNLDKYFLYQPGLYDISGTVRNHLFQFLWNVDGLNGEEYQNVQLVKEQVLIGSEYHMGWSLLVSGEEVWESAKEKMWSADWVGKPFFVWVYCKGGVFEFWFGGEKVYSTYTDLDGVVNLMNVQNADGIINYLGDYAPIIEGKRWMRLIEPMNRRYKYGSDDPITIAFKGYDDETFYIYQDANIQGVITEGADWEDGDGTMDISDYLDLKRGYQNIRIDGYYEPGLNDIYSFDILVYDDTAEQYSAWEGYPQLPDPEDPEYEWYTPIQYRFDQLIWYVTLPLRLLAQLMDQMVTMVESLTRGTAGVFGLMKETFSFLPPEILAMFTLGFIVVVILRILGR